MKREYSFWSLFKQGLQHNEGWEPAWRSPEPKPSYDFVIVGAGGHGLATAYYLAKAHGARNVAVIEKGYLGGGNTARNTTIVRSNYLWDEAALLYEHSLVKANDFSRLDAAFFTMNGVISIVFLGFVFTERLLR